MSRLSQTIDYLNAEKVTAEDKLQKYTDINIDAHLIDLRRQYRHAIKTKNKIEDEVLKKVRKE